MAKNHRKKLLAGIIGLVCITTVGFLVFAVPVFAQSTADGMLWGGFEDNVQASTGLGNTDPRIIAANVIRIFLGFLGIIAVILIIYGGFLWMTGGGNAQRLDKAKKTLTSAVIGLIIVLMAFGIASFVLNMLLTATGGNACNFGVDPPRNCGCYGSQTCQADGTWSLCDTVCSIGEACCPVTGCQVPPCSVIPPIDCDDTLGATCVSPNDANCPVNYYCDSTPGPTECRCLPSGNFGDPCDADTSSSACVTPLDSLCMQDLQCDDDVLSPTACTCIGAPVIDYVSPPDGATGNLVTIGGRYFGTTTGQVFFNGVLASFPNTVNANCADFWTERQVIVVVPGAATDGPIRLVRADLDEDSTNDPRGPNLPNFDVNNIVRPGLCGLSTTTGIFGDVLTYQGINLGGADAFFGNYNSNVAAIGSNFPLATPNTGTAVVPDIRPGNISTFASTTYPSNYMQFQIMPLAVSGPYISSFDPINGPPGQYVTIYGVGFGHQQGGSTVFFGVTEADYSFPDVCADSVWSDNQVIVKVPPGVSGNQTIFMNIGSWPAIDTTGLSPNAFNITGGTPMASICKINPRIGPNNSPVSLWGEYFGAVSDVVRFHLNNNQNIHSFWGSDTDPLADRIDTTVEQSAVTGPVSVVLGGTPGNSVNFTVGVCTEAANPDAACGGVCCPVGTFKEGRCAVDDILLGGNGDGFVRIDDCVSSIPSSVYEWDFTTITNLGVACDSNTEAPSCQPDHVYCQNQGYNFCDWNAGCICSSASPPCDSATSTPGCQPDNTFCQSLGYDICDDLSGCVCANTTFESCGGYSLDQCLVAEFCPNSAGQCSTYAGGNPRNIGNCDLNCDNVSPLCAPSLCSYNGIMDRCVNATVCDLQVSTFTDILGNPVESFCADYNGSDQWHIRTILSCPTSTPGWIKIAPGNICVNTTLGCASCSDGFICLDDEVGADTQGLCAIATDICPPASTCQNNPSVCGSIAADCCIDTDSPLCECCCEIGQSTRDCCDPLICMGSCGSDPALGECSGCALAGTTQKDRNDACNCFGFSGKFCDTTDPVYPDGVCRDCARLDNNIDCNFYGAGSCCFDIKNNNDVCRGGNPSLIAGGYCPYYDCEPIPTNDQCDTDTPLTDAPYADIFDCMAGCSRNNPLGGMGLTCSFGYATDTCDILPCSMQCINFDSSDPIEPLSVSGETDTCGVCCCRPESTDCDALALDCHANKGLCTGSDRGLCCGCTEDNDCALTPPASSHGCGIDNCCYPRPAVVVGSEIPADDFPSACRNAAMMVTFNEPMDTGSFSGNVIVVGDYGANPCPAGTVYLASDTHKERHNNFVWRGYYKLKNYFSDIFGSVLPTEDAYALTPPAASRNYCAITGSTSGTTLAGQTTLMFSPSTLLDGDILYYVIIKGDEDLDSSSGVRSQWGIGMNGNMDLTFNGITYANSHVWSFMVMSELATNDGICMIDHVSMVPESYLFQTAENSAQTNENDTDSTATTFDKIIDSDKAFIAYPENIDGQALAPIPGIYFWTWNWTSSDILTADIVGPSPFPAGEENSQLVRAGIGKTDGHTLLTANAVIGNPSAVPLSPTGATYPGSADVYIFICENPWPPVGWLNPGQWQPWEDRANNCVPPSALVCNQSYNYKIYYCRDRGRPGTFDDLPAITNDRVIVGENLPGLLKEYYFFREDSPSSTSTLTVSDGLTGGIANASWTAVGADGYRLYWGNTPGFYANSYDAGAALFYHVPALTNGITYYFNLTAYFDTGAESGMHGEVQVIPTDSTAPLDPVGLTASSSDSEITLRWNPDLIGDVVSYNIYYRSSSCAGAIPPACYGNVQNIGVGTSIIVAGLTNSSDYYFAITAIDSAGNESGYSNEVLAAPLAPPPLPPMPPTCGDSICDLIVDCAVGCDCTPADCCGNTVCDAAMGETPITCVADCP